MSYVGDTFGLPDRPIAYHRDFVYFTRSVTAAVLLSQACYWQIRCTDGWFWKTQEQWEEETGLTRTEQETARRILRELDVLKEKRQGIPAKLHFRVDAEQLQSRLQESRRLVRLKAANSGAGTMQPIYGTETTQRVQTETTSEAPAELLLSSPVPVLPRQPPVIVLPLQSDKVHQVSADSVAMWEQAYPAVDVRAELKRILVWLDAHEEKRSKTVGGSKKRIVAWLNREQDRGGRPHAGNQHGGFPSKAEQRVSGNKAVYNAVCGPGDREVADSYC